MKIEIGGNENDPHEDHVQVDVYGSPAIRADIRALPFRHSVDEIYMSHVLEHLPDADIVPALKSCRGALVKEGVLEVYVPDLLWLLRKFLKASPGARWALWNRFLYGSQEHEGQYHRTGFSVMRLSTCLIAAGFRKVDVDRRRMPLDFLPPEMKASHNLVKPMEIHAVASS